MPKYCTVMVIAGFLFCCGCHHYGYYPKRQSELNCPTDIRQTVPWCAGEDAVFHCPCGPSPHFYGHKPTCWGDWPTAGSQWRDSYCGCPIIYATEDELSVPTPVAEPLPQAIEGPSENGALRSMPPAKSQAEPLFVVPPPKAVSKQEPEKENHIVAKGASTGSARFTPAKKQAHGRNSLKKQADIQQVSYIEEEKLEAHSWTGIKFIR